MSELVNTSISAQEEKLLNDYEAELKKVKDEIKKLNQLSCEIDTDIEILLHKEYHIEMKLHVLRGELDNITDYESFSMETWEPLDELRSNAVVEERNKYIKKTEEKDKMEDKSIHDIIDNFNFKVKIN